MNAWPAENDSELSADDSDVSAKDSELSADELDAPAKDSEPSANDTRCLLRKAD